MSLSLLAKHRLLATVGRQISTKEKSVHFDCCVFNMFGNESEGNLELNETTMCTELVLSVSVCCDTLAGYVNRRKSYLKPQNESSKIYKFVNNIKSYPIHFHIEINTIWTATFSASHQVLSFDRVYDQSYSFCLPFQRHQWCRCHPQNRLRDFAHQIFELHLAELCLIVD